MEDPKIFGIGLLKNRFCAFSESAASGFNFNEDHIDRSKEDIAAFSAMDDFRLALSVETVSIRAERAAGSLVFLFSSK